MLQSSADGWRRVLAPRTHHGAGPLVAGITTGANASAELHNHECAHLQKLAATAGSFRTLDTTVISFFHQLKPCRDRQFIVTLIISVYSTKCPCLLRNRMR